MKKLSLITMMLAVTAGLGHAQKKTNVNETETRSSSKAGVERIIAPDESRNKNEAGGERLLLDSNTAIDATLTETIDARKANVGDEVILKTKKSVRQNGEVVIPKGAKLIGRITEVQKRDRSNQGSKIGMVIDRIEGKGLASPITATIVSITNARAASTVGDTIGSDISGSSTTSGQASAGRSGSGGGLLGGVGSAVGSTAGAVLNTTTQTAGTVLGTVGQAAGQTVGTAAGTLGQTINGINISQSVSGSASGSTTLSSQNRNIRLEEGLTFHLMLSSSANN